LRLLLRVKKVSQQQKLMDAYTMACLALANMHEHMEGRD
jgi:hypothetical protein